MTRSTVIEKIRAYLASVYEGPITIEPEVSTDDLSPPYAVVRVGSSEGMYPGVAEIWDMSVMIGVFHDADATTADDAESQAAALFALLDDPVGLYTFTSDSLVWSAMEPVTMEASIVEKRWQHVAAFRAIVAPTEPVPEGD